MNEKEIYKDFNNINIDEHEFDDIDVEMTDIQKHNLKSRLKNNIKTRKFIKTKIGAATAASLLLFIGIGYANPSFASQIPILNPIVEMLGQTGDYANYSDIVNKKVTYNGKSFTINSVVCYDNNVIIGYTAESNTKIDSTGPLFFPTFKVNGKWLNVGSGGVAKNVNDKTIMGTLELMTGNDLTLPENFQFDMSFQKFDSTAGNWDFNFNISKSELSKNTKVYKPNQDMTFNNKKGTITEITLSPLDTAISIHSNIEYDKSIVGSEEAHKTEFEVNRTDFIVLDDKGNELSEESGQATPGPGGFYSFNKHYSKINMDTKYLTLIPVIGHGGGYAYGDQNGKTVEVENPDPYDAKDVSVPINTSLPIDISEGNIGKVTLTKISVLNDKATICGVIYGKLPNEQYVVLQGDNPKADIRLLNTTIKKIGDDKYELTEEFSGLNNDKNFKIIAPNLDYDEYDSRITVPLK